MRVGAVSHGVGFSSMKVFGRALCHFLLFFDVQSAVEGSFFFEVQFVTTKKMEKMVQSVGKRRGERGESRRDVLRGTNRMARMDTGRWAKLFTRMLLLSLCTTAVKYVQPSALPTGNTHPAFISSASSIRVFNRLSDTCLSGGPHFCNDVRSRTAPLRTSIRAQSRVHHLWKSLYGEPGDGEVQKDLSHLRAREKDRARAPARSYFLSPKPQNPAMRDRWSEVSTKRGSSWGNSSLGEGKGQNRDASRQPQLQLHPPQPPSSPPPREKLHSSSKLASASKASNVSVVARRSPLSRYTSSQPSQRTQLVDKSVAELEALVTLLAADMLTSR